MAKISKERIGEYLKTALQILDENGGQLPSKEVIKQLGLSFSIRGFLGLLGRDVSISSAYHISLQSVRQTGTLWGL